MVKTLCFHYKGHGFNPWRADHGEPRMQTEKPGSVAQPHCGGVPGGAHCGYTIPSAPEADLWGQRSITRTLASAAFSPPMTTGCTEEQVGLRVIK